MRPVLDDVRDALRLLRRSNSFVIPCVFILSLCFASTTLFFTLVNGVVLRRLSYRDPTRLVWIWSTRTDRDRAFFSIPNFQDTVNQSRTIENFSAFSVWGANLSGHGQAERFQGLRISANAFAMLGVQASYGRLLNSSDDLPGSENVVVLSAGVFERSFGSDPSVVGRKIVLNDDPYVVVGVLPKTFVIPNADTDIITALRMSDDPRRSNRGANFLRVFARVRPEFKLDQVRADLATISDRLRSQYPDDNAKLTAPTVRPLQSEIVGDYGSILLLLFGAVSLVFLIVCANLAHLFLARGMKRRKEIALRTALGAGSGQAITLLLMENLLLIFPAGLLGIFIAVLAKQPLLSLTPADLPRAQEITIGGVVYCFVIAISFVLSLLFTVLQYRQFTNFDLVAELRASKANAIGGRSGLLRDMLVISEIAFAFLLLFSAGIWLKSFVTLQSINPGFEIKNVTVMRLSFAVKSYPDVARIREFYEKLSNAMLEIPGTLGVAFTNAVPLSGMNMRTDYYLSRRPPVDQKDMPAAQIRYVSPGYFKIFDIPLIHGREFDSQDDAGSRKILVIDESIARQHFGDQDPIGQEIILNFSEDEKIASEIVGVVGNVKQNELNEPPTPTFYAPLFQMPEDNIPRFVNDSSFVIRSNVPIHSEDLRRKLASVDPHIPASSIKNMQQVLASTIAARRFFLWLILGFAWTGLVLSGFGIYAVLSSLVNLRMQEIGVRYSLGAAPAHILKLISGQGMKLTLIGLIAGFAATFPIRLLLRPFLIQTSASEASVIFAIMLFLVVVAFLASWLPARRASKIDPMDVLRCE